MSARETLRVATWFVRSVIARRRRILSTAPIGCWLPMLAGGFYPDRYHAYGLDRRDRRQYLSDVGVLRTYAIDGRAGVVLEDKLLLEAAMPARARMPATIVLVRDGRPVWFRHERDRGRSLADLVRERGSLFSKPRGALGGEGAALLEFRDGGLWRNGSAVDSARSTWGMFGAGDALICEVVRQGRFAARLFDRTVNTVRAITMLDQNGGRPFVAAAMLRIGTSESFPVDNISKGGVLCGIELETGRLGRGIIHYFHDEPLRFVDRHPETGVVFQEETIPRWREVCGELLEVAACLPGLPYIAWDVALLDDGISIVEGNRWSDLSAFQVDRPLLADPRVRAFFGYHRVLAGGAARGGRPSPSRPRRTLR